MSSNVKCLVGLILDVGKTGGQISKLLFHPTNTFSYNFSVSKSVDRLILCTSEKTFDEFSAGTNIVKSVGRVVGRGNKDLSFPA